MRRNAVLQVGVLVVAWMGCEAIVALAGIPLPGGVVGFFLLVFGLLSGLVSSAWLARGASGLLNHLVLFFVPAMVALVGRPELFGALGVKLFLVIAFGTMAVMASTALIVELGMRLRRERES
jgi:holin-like protein